jgi:polar amino acid transport system substrate-binding protein
MNQANVRRLSVMRRAAGLPLVILWLLGAQAMAEPVRIAHSLSFPPYAELKDGKSEGLAVDILRAAAAAGKVDFVLVGLPFDQLQPALADGRADAVFPTADTSERRQTFEFSAPLLATGGALYVRAPNLAPDSLGGLEGKTVVTPRTGPLVAVIEKTAPAVKLVVTANYEDSLQLLVNGEADAAALNVHVGSRLANRLHPGKIVGAQKMFFEVPLAVMVRKGQQATFLRDLNAGLAAIRANGTWGAINERWAGR